MVKSENLRRASPPSPPPPYVLRTRYVFSLKLLNFLEKKCQDNKYFCL